jgi:GxxExxY protein
MHADNEPLKYKELTDLIIKAFYKVYSTLGYGFLEKVYLNALIIELAKLNVSAVPQCLLQVIYDGEIVGEYYADLIVENFVIVEIKATKILTIEHEAQLLNYLKATKIEVGLLLNFGPKPEFKRRVFNNDRKTSAI